MTVTPERPNAWPRVGFVGTGHMGLPICRRLLAAGVPLVVHNRTPEKAAPLVALGAAYADTPGALAIRADIVLTCLDTVAASEAVFLGPDGIVARARSGTLALDHGTIAPALAERVGQAAAARGVDYLDAPVSGGPEGAERGTLTIMAGGGAAAFERARPVLGVYGQLVRRVGDVGAGTRAKLVNQLLAFAHAAAAAEAIALAERVGLDLDALGELLHASFGQSRMLERTLGRVRAADFDAGAALRLFAKDLGLVAALAGDTGASVPVTEAARAVLHEALARGLGDHDVAALVLAHRPPAR